MITGLALESSDMDLAVTNLNLVNREKMIQALELLAGKLREDSNIQNLHSITTATIPVIKAEVDLNKIRSEIFQMENPQDKMRRQLLQQTLPEDVSVLKIDITFDDNLESG